MDTKLLTDGASVSSSLTHSTDLSSSSNTNNFPSIKFNLATSVYVDEVFVCQNNPKLLKKLNFVVCSERSLEIHESEKTYRKKKRAKHIIDLSTVYAITKRENEKVKHCLMLVTAEQTFYLRSPKDTATNEWYALLISNIHTSRSLVQGRQISYNDFPDSIWDVNVTYRPKVYHKAIHGKVENLITKDKRAIGRKRLCFFPHSVVLLQMHTEPGDIGSNTDRDPDEQDPENYFYFPRPLISYYGCCNNKYFFIKTSASMFGTFEVVMDCETRTAAEEIFKKFRDSALKNVQVHDGPWQQMFEECQNGEKDEYQDDDEYYNPKKNDASSSGNQTIPTLAAATSYCIEDSSTKKPVKEVRFKTEEQSDMQPVEKPIKEPTIDDGDVGKAIAIDIIRMNTNKVPTKKSSNETSNPFTGIIASIKKKFHDKSPSPPPTSAEEEAPPIVPDVNCFKEQVAELKQWAENRASLIEDETEDSGGTLKIDDPSLLYPDASTQLSVEEQRRVRRDALLSNAVKEYSKNAHRKVADNAIEMKDLSAARLTDSSTESSSCADSTVDSESSQKSENKETKVGSNSSTSALDSCISNTSEDFSASSSVSNVEYTWKPIMKFIKAKKRSLETSSCSGKLLQTQIQDNSDASVDSCYSSLTNNGYHQLPKSQSLTQLICEVSAEADKKSPTTSRSTKLTKFEIKPNTNCIIEPMEEPAKSTLKPIKSSSDIMSDAQQEALRLEIVKIDDPESLAAAIRQRAASLGNKSWTVTPLGQSIRKQRHRQDCKKRKSNSSANNSTLSEERPLLGDPRHSSISSQSEQSCSHRNNASAARVRLAHALLRKNPRRSNTEDLAEISFEKNSPGGSLGSMNGGNGETHRETIQAFGGTNRALIPTTRYSEGSNTRNKASKTRRHKKGYELEVVECFIDPKDFEPISKNPQKTGSSSSHESVDNVPRCRHGKPRRHQNHSNNSQDSNEHRHSCRRKHRTSHQDAIAEEECAQPPESTQPPTNSDSNKTSVETEKADPDSSLNSETLNSEESSQKSTNENAVPELNLDRLNNNPNPLTIFA